MLAKIGQFILSNVLTSLLKFLWERGLELWDAARKAKERKAKEKVDEAIREAYEDSVTDPNTPREERRRRATDLLNG